MSNATDLAEKRARLVAAADLERLKLGLAWRDVRVAIASVSSSARALFWWTSVASSQHTTSTLREELASSLKRTRRLSGKTRGWARRWRLSSSMTKASWAALVP